MLAYYECNAISRLEFYLIFPFALVGIYARFHWNHCVFTHFMHHNANFLAFSSWCLAILVPGYGLILWSAFRPKYFTGNFKSIHKNIF